MCAKKNEKIQPLYMFSVSVKYCDFSRFGKKIQTKLRISENTP